MSDSESKDNIDSNEFTTSTTTATTAGLLPPINNPNNTNNAAATNNEEKQSTSSSSTTTAVVHHPSNSSRSRNSTNHNLPELSSHEQHLLYDQLPQLHLLDDSINQLKSQYQIDLRSASLAVLRDWLSDKLRNSSWVQLIESIKIMAEGDEFTALHSPTESLELLGLDRNTLRLAGIPSQLVQRIYRSLWVYSVGIHEICREVTYHCKKSNKSHNNTSNSSTNSSNNRTPIATASQIVGSIWKCYSILLEDYSPNRSSNNNTTNSNKSNKSSNNTNNTNNSQFNNNTSTNKNKTSNKTPLNSYQYNLANNDYVLACISIERTAQSTLKRLETFFSTQIQAKSLVEKQTYGELNKLQSLLTISQLEARTLLENKESLLSQILHLESDRSDLESLIINLKKNLWQTTNALNKTSGALESLQRSSESMQLQLTNNINSLTGELYNLKLQLDNELLINEKLIFKINRLNTVNIEYQNENNKLKLDIELLQSNNNKSVLDLNTTKSQLQLSNNIIIEKNNTILTLENKIKSLQSELELAELARQLLMNNPNNNNTANTAGNTELTAENIELKFDREKLLKSIEKMKIQRRKLKSIILNLTDMMEEAATTANTAHNNIPTPTHSSGNTLTEPPISSERKRRSSVSSATASAAAAAAAAATIVDPAQAITNRLVALSAKYHPNNTSNTAATTADSDSEDESFENSELSREFQLQQSKSKSALKQQKLLQSTVKKLKTQLSNNESEIESITKKSNDSSIVNQQLEQQIKSLKSALVVAERKPNDDAIKVKELESLLKSQSIDIQSHSAVKLQLQAQIDDLHVQLVELENANRSLNTDKRKSAVSSLQRENKQQQLEIEQRTKNQQELGLKVRTLQQELIRITAVLEAVSSANKSQSDSSSLLQTLELKTSEVTKLQSRVRELEQYKSQSESVYQSKLTESLRRVREELNKSNLKQQQQQQRNDDSNDSNNSSAKQKKLRQTLIDQQNQFNEQLNTFKLKYTESQAELIKQKELFDREKDRLNRATAAAEKEKEKLQSQLFGSTLLRPINTAESNNQQQSPNTMPTLILNESTPIQTTVAAPAAVTIAAPDYHKQQLEESNVSLKHQLSNLTAEFNEFKQRSKLVNDRQKDREARRTLKSSQKAAAIIENNIINSNNNNNNSNPSSILHSPIISTSRSGTALFPLISTERNSNSNSNEHSRRPSATAATVISSHSSLSLSTVGSLTHLVHTGGDGDSSDLSPSSGSEIDERDQPPMDPTAGNSSISIGSKQHIPHKPIGTGGGIHSNNNNNTNTVIGGLTAFRVPQPNQNNKSNIGQYHSHSSAAGVLISPRTNQRSH